LGVQRLRLDAPYDVFISYARRDDADGWVSVLCEAIYDDFRSLSTEPFRIFFDRSATAATVLAMSTTTAGPARPAPARPAAPDTTAATQTHPAPRATAASPCFLIAVVKMLRVTSCRPLHVGGCSDEGAHHGAPVRGSTACVSSRDGSASARVVGSSFTELARPIGNENFRPRR